MTRFPVHNGPRGEIATLLVALLAVIVLVLGGYKAIGWAADYMASKVPDKLETELFGSLGAKQSGWKQDTDSPAQKRAAGIFKRLAKAKDLRALDYQLYFMGDKQPNAFAMPGGSIAVTDGLLKLVEGDIGLAMVLGHEFGHQQHRHSLKRMGRTLLLAGVMLLVVGDAGFLVSTAIDLAAKSHSRDQELEADAYGLRLVHKLYGTTEGALEFFQKLDKDPATKDPSRALAILSTHPYTPERIERLKAMQAELNAKKAP